MVALGVAVSTAVLTGALVVGDSMQFTLQRLVDLRLGSVTHTLTAGDRFFTASLADRMEANGDMEVTPVLLLEGSAVAGGGQKRMPGVQVIGTRPDFGNTTGVDSVFDQLESHQVFVSQNLADRLDVKPGDMLLLRIRKASLIPMNAPFVSDDEITLPLRLQIGKILSPDELGRFHLRNSQTAPYNAFVSLSVLDELMELQGRVNTLLINGLDANSQQIRESLGQSWIYADAGLNMTPLGDHHWQITSDRVFMDAVQEEAIIQSFGNTKPVLTYFVNSLSYHSNSAPYSFVAGIADPDIRRGEIRINQWLADDLGVGLGDTLGLSYFEVGPLRKLTESQASFTVQSVCEMSGDCADSGYMPNLPGLSDVGNCRDWETGVPIKLESIRDKDEDYWDAYQGAPKAFINLEQAKELWGNRFGDLTAVRLEEPDLTGPQFTGLLRQHLQIADLGFEIRGVKTIGQHAARNGVNFGELFLGLSFFVLLSALILSVLLYGLTLRSRMGQLGLFRSLGFSGQRIQLLMLGESAVTAITGGILGLFLAWGYNHLIFAGLNSIWHDIIRTDLIFLKITPGALMTGFASSVLISFLSLYLAVKRLLKRRLVDLKPAKTRQQSLQVFQWEFLAFIVFFFGSLGLIFWQIKRGEQANPGLFFAAGGMLLAGFTVGADLFLKTSAQKISNKLSVSGLALKNCTRNQLQSISVILLLALGTFLVVTVGANRKTPITSEPSPSDGTGGFDLFVQTAAPILKDLNDPEVRQEFNLEAGNHFVQFRQNAGDDASCLNLNAISQPRILGLAPEELSGRFSFQTQTDNLDPETPWLSLNQELDDNLIPGIADQTVIQWSLLKKVGDTLWYTGQDGEEFGILLIGGLAASVFQGNLLVSEKHFLKHFPSSSGSQVFLVNAEEGKREEILTTLNMSLRDYGLEIQDTRVRLAEFSTINNTYLSIFLLLGALGLVIGTIGLGIILARNIQDRKSEIALQRAIGISGKSIFTILTMQFAGLMITGILIGALSAIIAVLPVIVSPGSEIQIGYLLGIIGIIITNGLIWIALFSYSGLRKVNIAKTLKND